MIKDVEPLLKECEKTLTELKAIGEMNGACYVQGFINSINKLPIGWIPAEEAIPEDQKDVLVWYEFFAYGNLNKMVQSFGIGHVYNGFWSGDVQGTKAKCLAWMPLPEPYREEGGEE